MTQTRIVNYKSAKAYYKVEYNNDKTFVATLEKYTGSNEQMPPRKVTYIKQTALPFEKESITRSLLDDVSRATGKR